MNKLLINLILSFVLSIFLYFMCYFLSTVVFRHELDGLYFKNIISSMELKCSIAEWADAWIFNAESKANKFDIINNSLYKKPPISGRLSSPPIKVTVWEVDEKNTPLAIKIHQTERTGIIIHRKDAKYTKLESQSIKIQKKRLSLYK